MLLLGYPFEQHTRINVSDAVYELRAALRPESAATPPTLNAEDVLDADGLAMLDASIADDSPGIPVEDVRAATEGATDA